MSTRSTVLLAAVAQLAACGPDRAARPAAASLTSAPFGTAADGRPVTRYTMTSRSGVQVSFISYGGIITDVRTPDRQGRVTPIVLGFSTLREYETIGARNGYYFGALIGRFANWIDRGRFTLDGRPYQLSLSDPPNTIHGGVKGFDKRIWNVTPLTTSGPVVAARLTYTSPDGEEGYPGTLKTRVTYSLSQDGDFTIRYQAVTDKPTIINLTSHMNFNLAGAGQGHVLGHSLTIAADRYLLLGRGQIPTGATAPVASTPFDFRRATAIGARIHDRDPQLALANGYDQNWVLDRPGLTHPAVRVLDPASGRTLEMSTTEPAVGIYTGYTGGFFRGGTVGTGGRYVQYAGFTLETQHYPDSPNHPNFPSTVLRPGQTFDSTTVFRFGGAK